MATQLHSTVELTKAFLMWVPPHHEQYYRPYHLELTNDTMNSLLHATNDGLNVNRQTLSSVSSSILMPSITPCGQIAIPNGLQNSRFAFFLEVTIENALTGIREREIISGFTNYDGVMPNSGSIDPEMTFHINGRMVIRDNGVSVGPNGQHRNLLVQHAQQVLHAAPGMKSLRPEDVVGQGQSSILLGGGDYSANYNVVDIRSDLGKAAKTNKRDNALGNYYLEGICKGYLGSLSDAALENRGGSDEIYANAMSHVRSAPIELSEFVNCLSGPSVEGTHTFTFAQIAHRWPRSPEFWRINMPRPGQQMQASIREYTEHWRGANIETNVAYSITQALPAILSRLMILGVVVEMTNMTLDGMPSIVVMHHTPMFDGVVSTMHLQQLERLLEIDILTGILRNKADYYRIRIDASVLSKAFIEISLDGQPAVQYAAPLYCDAYFSPVITEDASSLPRLQSDIEIMVDAMNEARCQKSGLNPVSLRNLEYDNPPSHDYY